MDERAIRQRSGDPSRPSAVAVREEKGEKGSGSVLLGPRARPKELPKNAKNVPDPFCPFCPPSLAVGALGGFSRQQATAQKGPSRAPTGREGDSWHRTTGTIGDSQPPISSPAIGGCPLWLGASGGLDPARYAGVSELRADSGDRCVRSPGTGPGATMGRRMAQKARDGSFFSIGP